MAKFKIAQQPTFAVPVAIPQVGSAPVEVSITFKYLDRLALAAFVDRLAADAKQLSEQAEGRNTADQAKAEIEAQVGQLREIVHAWEFEDELNEDSLRALAVTCIGAPAAVSSAFFDAYRNARLGN